VVALRRDVHERDFESSRAVFPGIPDRMGIRQTRGSSHRRESLHGLAQLAIPDRQASRWGTVGPGHNSGFAATTALAEILCRTRRTDWHDPAAEAETYRPK